MSVIEAKNVSIRYITGDFKDIGLKEYIIRRIQGRYQVKEFWADQDVSFSLEKGEMLGIIGGNGAGKSTLLKAVSGIMEPTRGSIRRNGTIAALLELGSGFDGDLTVKENIYLRGAMLGYSRRFIDDTYGEILDFSGLQDYEDRPFKQLSSGMKSRLAFAIACLVKPDVLILDEVLSVGDSGFRSKSEEKMKEIIGSGTTTILVSHSISQVRELCDKVLWLDHGVQIAFGDQVDNICDAYEAMMKLRNDDKNLALKPAREPQGEATLRFALQPQSVTTELGETAVFRVEVEGEGQFFYQWEVKSPTAEKWNRIVGHDCSGMNGPELSVPALALRDGLLFRCALLGVYENYYSDEVSLHITPPDPVVILTQPVSVTAKEGDRVRFQVETNLKGLSYQWQCHPIGGNIWNNVTNVNCKGMRSPTMTVPAERFRNGFTYHCRITSVGETVFSDEAVLTVLPK